MRIAVNSGLFPLYEVFDGLTYQINVEPDGTTDPADYFSRQKRFHPDEIDLEATRKRCENRFNQLRALARINLAPVS